MVVVVGRTTLSLPSSEHNQAWQFFTLDYLRWVYGPDDVNVDVQFELAWFTPHQKPNLTQFNQTGITTSIWFGDLGEFDSSLLGEVLSPLANP
jgi:hypothetical protein